MGTRPNIKLFRLYSRNDFNVDDIVIIVKHSNGKTNYLSSITDVENNDKRRLVQKSCFYGTILRDNYIQKAALIMGRHTIFTIVALTFVWCILMEAFTWQTVAIGLFVSMLALHFFRKFFGFDEIKNVNFRKLLIYPLWLLWRIYVDAFFLMKLIVTDAKWGMMTEELVLENESLRLMLADSITLTPGSVYISRDKKNITLLCIGSRKKEGYPASVDDLRKIEGMLLAAQTKEGLE